MKTFQELIQASDDLAHDAYQAGNKDPVVLALLSNSAAIRALAVATQGPQMRLAQALHVPQLTEADKERLQKDFEKFMSGGVLQVEPAPTVEFIGREDKEGDLDTCRHCGNEIRFSGTWKHLSAYTGCTGAVPL